MSEFFFGLSLLKPTVSLPYGILYLVRKKPSALLVAFGTSLVYFSFWFWMTGLGVGDSLQARLFVAKSIAFEGDGPINLLEIFGLSAGSSTIANAGFWSCWPAISSESTSNWLFRRCVRLSRLELASATYHRAYDNVIMVFLLIGLAVQTDLRGWRKRDLFIYLVMGSSLWLPTRTCQWLTLHYKYWVWLFTAGYLLVSALQGTKPPSLGSVDEELLEKRAS